MNENRIKEDEIGICANCGHTLRYSLVNGKCEIYTEDGNTTSFCPGCGMELDYEDILPAFS